jgi:hypothetical protein
VSSLNTSHPSELHELCISWGVVARHLSPGGPGTGGDPMGLLELLHMKWWLGYRLHGHLNLNVLIASAPRGAEVSSLISPHIPMHGLAVVTDPPITVIAPPSHHHIVPEFDVPGVYASGIKLRLQLHRNLVADIQPTWEQFFSIVGEHLAVQDRAGAPHTALVPVLSNVGLGRTWPWLQSSLDWNQRECNGSESRPYNLGNI